MTKNLGGKYNPLYFLSALGSGGLAVSFFIYMQFMIPHKKTPMVTFNHIWDAFQTGEWFIKAGIVLAVAGLITFAILHIRLLFWNLAEYSNFKKTPIFQSMKDSPAAISFMAIPLTLSMTLNVLLVLGAVFIPDLWSVIEYLFPAALLGFALVGIYALRIFGHYMINLFAHGDPNFVNTNNLSNLLSIFTFAMIAVGFAAPGAMSHNVQVNSIGIFMGLFFLALSIILAIVKFTLGFRSIIEKGIAVEGSPSLWIVIPFLTLVGITGIRLLFGLDHHYNDKVSDASLFVLTGSILALQLLNGAMGYGVMKKIGYFDQYVNGPKNSAGSLSLICPGVALVVFGMFFVHFGIVRNGIMDKFSIAYFLLLVPFVLVHIKTISVFIKLNKKLIFKTEEVQ